MNGSTPRSRRRKSAVTVSLEWTVEKTMCPVVAAWQAIGPDLYYVQGSPAIAFFYVLTVVHGLHLVGGLYVLGRAAHRFAGGTQLIDLRQSLSLCATYWHFLLLVWLAVFGMLLLA